jgi:hypothetical protein
MGTKEIRMNEYLWQVNPSQEFRVTSLQNELATGHRHHRVDTEHCCCQG